MTPARTFTRTRGKVSCGFATPVFRGSRGSLVSPRERLAAVLAPDVLAALEELVEQRVAEAIADVRPEAPVWLPVADAATYLGVSERTLERAVARGLLRSSTIGRRRLLYRDDLDAFVRGAAGEEIAPTTPPRRSPRSV